MANNDVKGGLGNSYTAQFWEYDSRIGRRWNLDPKPMTGMSEYSTFNNNPISLSDLLGDTVKFENQGVSPEEFAQTQQEINVLRKESRTFRRMYRDLDKSKATWTFQITNNNGGGGGSDPHKFRLGRNWKDEDDDLGDQVLNRYSHYAHEFAHVWRANFKLDRSIPAEPKYKGIEYPSLMATKAERQRIEANNRSIIAQNKVNRDNFALEKFGVMFEWESEASHLQNIVLSELMKTHQSIFTGIKLRKTYDNGPELVTAPDGGLFVNDYSGTINLLNPPRTTDYYMNNKINIYREYKIKR